MRDSWDAGVTLAAERLTQLEDADDDADGVTYLVHFHERFGAAQLVTVQSAFDKLLVMMQAAQDGKIADIPPNTLFMKADQLFKDQFSGADALQWLKIMIFCRVIDQQKYDSVLKDMDLQRSRLKNATGEDCKGHGGRV